MKPTDTPPCPHCGDTLTETPPDADAARWDYDCAACMWHVEYPARLALADAPWTREVWAHAARLERILAVERGDQSAAPEGWRFDVAVDYDWTHDHHFSDIAKGRGRWYWYRCDVECGTAPTALEAMEAADRAAKESP